MLAEVTIRPDDDNSLGGLVSSATALTVLGARGSYDPNHPDPPGRTYVSLYRAYAFFNAELFEGILPPCLITLQRKRGAYGYFSPKRFMNVDDAQEVADEIALNPARFAEQTATRVLSTLVHEMVHKWQYGFGKPGRGRYHNEEWARKMRDAGLMPSDTGQPGGKATGERVSHYIYPGGRFDLACRAFLAKEATVLFQDRAYRVGADRDGSAGPDGGGAEGEARGGLRKAASKTRYTCVRCGLKAWAKPGVELLCMRCEEQMLS